MLPTFKQKWRLHPSFDDSDSPDHILNQFLIKHQLIFEFVGYDIDLYKDRFAIYNDDDRLALQKAYKEKQRRLEGKAKPAKQPLMLNPLRLRLYKWPRRK